MERNEKDGKTMQIGNKEIGTRTYVIAEAGVNHNGSLYQAKKLIEAAAKAGCDAIKFQTYTADELVCKGTPKFWNWDGDKDKTTQYDAYKAIGGFPYEHYPTLINYCQENNIEFLSTPFSFEAADFLNSIGMEAFKVASSDMSCLPFLEHIAQYNKPILLSTGASTLEEIKEAVTTIRKYHNQIVVMHCILHYPTDEKDANLNVITTLRKEFPDLPIGISDHTLGKFPPMVAVAMGACMVEKHFTTDKTLPDSADHWLSVEPFMMQQIVEHIRRVELLKGTGDRYVYESEQETRKYDKRSVVSKTTIPAGTKLTADLLTFKRPGTGIEPRDYKTILGMVATQDIPEDIPLQWEMLSKT
jgi:N,N'-diacetyllegionaminate synthase